MLCIYVFIDLFLLLVCVFAHVYVQVLEEGRKEHPQMLGLNSAPHNRASGILNAGPSLEFYSSVSWHTVCICYQCV